MSRLDGREKNAESESREEKNQNNLMVACSLIFFMSRRLRVCFCLFKASFHFLT